MRRRLVDLGLTAVGAAALIGLVKALPLLAAFITLPTTWVSGQILTSSDLNAQFAAILAQANGNLDDTNISSSAAIKGSKLADSPNGITTTKLNDLSVTVDKLAVGSTRGAAANQDGVTALNVASTDGEQNWLLFPAMVTRGGPVLMLCTLQGSFQQASGDLSSVVVKVYRDGTVIEQETWALSTPGGGTGDDIKPIPAPNLGAFATAAGSHVFKITVTVTGSGHFITDATMTGRCSAVEMS